MAGVPNVSSECAFRLQKYGFAPSYCFGGCEDRGKEPQDLIDELELGENPLLRFEDAYPEAECENLVALQDPDDVAALNAVVHGINSIVAQRRATREALEALLAQVNAVYAKYPRE